MEASDVERMSYDMPPDQLNYFDSRARASSTFVTPTSVHLLYDKWTPGCNHEMQRCTQERLKSGENEFPAVTREESLFEKYQQYFRGLSRGGTESRFFKADSAAIGIRPEGGSYPHRVLEPKTATPKLASRVPSHVSSEEPVQPSVRPKPSSRRHSYREAAADASNFHLGHSSLPRSYSDTPQEQLSGNNSSRNQNMLRRADCSGTSRSQYEQPRRARQAPISKLSLSCGTPVSCDSRSEMSASARSQNGGSETQQRARERSAAASSHVPRQVNMIPPVREVEDQALPNCLSRRSTVEGMTDKYEQMDNNEENFTFHFNKKNLSGLRRKHVQPSAYRSRDETDPPRSSRGDYGDSVYDKMYDDAVAAKQRSDSRRAQKELNDAEMERNAVDGSFSALANPNRSAVDRHGDTEEVFSRLYADAQRYNREKSEQERLIELKRRQERGEVPYDLGKGSKPKEDAPGLNEDCVVNGEEKSAAAKTHVSTPRRRNNVIPPIFERLSRPQKVTVKFEMQKRQAEQERREKEQRAAKEKERETEKFACYQWGVPTKSFTFSDLESHNSLYAS